MFFIARKEKRDFAKLPILSGAKRSSWFFYVCSLFLGISLSLNMVSAESVNLDDFSVSGIGNFNDSVSVIEHVDVKQGYKSVSISWERGSLQETEAIVLIRGEGKCPLFPGDGVELYRGNGNLFQDKNTFAGMKYCYGLFVTDASGRRSRMIVSDLIEKEGAATHLFSSIDGNRMIFAGIVTVLILAWMHKKTMYDLNKRKRRVVAL